MKILPAELLNHIQNFLSIRDLKFLQSHRCLPVDLKEHMRNPNRPLTSQEVAQVLRCLCKGDFRGIEEDSVNKTRIQKRDPLTGVWLPDAYYGTAVGAVKDHYNCSLTPRTIQIIRKGCILFADNHVQM